MNTQEEMKQRYDKLYKHMSASDNVEHMKLFGKVMNRMMDWMIANRPDTAREWIDELEPVMWDNYLTTKESDAIVEGMAPKRPWPREQWRQVMEQHGYVLEEEPYYNKCALYVTMSMIYSDSADTLKRYTNGADMFEVIHSLALDKLKDRDGVFSVRGYFRV